MCGIVGAKGLVDAGLLKKMKSSIRHRGPDQQGSYIDGKVMLGHQRLSILDLTEKGRQPMGDAEGRVHVVFNGEIYNYRTLKKELESDGYRFTSNSDTEVLVHGYKQWGESLPAKLDGDFGFAIWDSDQSRLMLARDPMGVVPLYYTQTSGAFLFASEIKALLAYEGVKRQLSPEALREYLCFRYPVGPRTLFEGIYKVQPGEMILVDERIRKKTFWNLQYEEKDITETQAVASVRRLVQESVQKRLQSDVPLGVYLSGGLDSSFVAACANTSGPVHTFSVLFGEDDETPYVDEMVNHIQSHHTYLRVDPDRYALLGQVAWHLDEPPADIAALPTYLMAQVTKPHASVVLTGDGGDEVFGGYTRYQRLLQIKAGKSVLKAGSTVAKHFLPKPIHTRLNDATSATNDWDLMLAYAATFSESERREWMENGTHPSIMPPDYLGSLSFPNKMYAWDVKTLLPDDYLMKVNKSSMAHAVEPRVPLLDMALVRYTAQLPTRFKATMWDTKIIQRKAMKGLVPDMIIKRQKRGFVVPISRWMKEGLREFAEPFFDSLAKRSYFKKDLVQRFLKSFGRHPAYDARQFWTLLGFEIWHQTFLDPDTPRPLKI